MKETWPPGSPDCEEVELASRVLYLSAVSGLICAA
jgi:hypothetical protein